MITINTIIALCKENKLHDCRFLSEDTSLAAICVDKYGVPYIKQTNESILLSSLSNDELKHIEENNTYYYKGFENELI